MSTKAATRIAIALAMLMGTTCLQLLSPAVASAPQPALVKLYGGPKGFAVLQKPDRVEAFRLSHAIGEEPVITAGPLKVEPPIAGQIVSILSAQKSYGWEFGKGCIPNWGVRLSFYRGADRLDVLLCFECDILAVSWNGKKAQHEDFDPVRAELVRAVKALFPDDPVIQKLLENRTESPGLPKQPAGSPK